MRFRQSASAAITQSELIKPDWLRITNFRPRAGNFATMENPMPTLLVKNIEYLATFDDARREIRAARSWSAIT